MTLSSKIISWFIIILLGWYVVSLAWQLVIGNAFGNYPLHLCVLMLFVCSIVKYGAKFPIEKKTLIILSVYLIYAAFFNYHAIEKQEISRSISLNYGVIFYTKALEFIVIACLFTRHTLDWNKILYRLFIILFFSMLLILYLLVRDYGFGFIYLESLTFMANVTLITFSYFIVFNSLVGIYLISCEELRFNKTLIALLLGISIILILILGKRAALFSLVVPALSMYFFRKITGKKSLFYVTMILVIFFLIIANIEFVFDLFSVFSVRLSEQLKSFYYFGDTNGRDFIWESGMQQFDKNILFGYYPRLIDIKSSYWCYGYHPHSYWIEALMTMGLVGSIPFFGYVIFILTRKCYNAILSNTPYRFWAIVFISEIIHGTFSSSLDNSHIWMTMFVLSCYTPTKESKRLCE